MATKRLRTMEFEGDDSIYIIPQTIMELEDAEEVLGDKLSASAQTEKTHQMTMPVGVDGNGKLWVSAGIGDMETDDYDPGEIVKNAGGIASYVDANGGKIDHIKVNGEEQEILGKTVDIDVPTELSELSDDSTHRTVTDVEKTSWGGKYSKPSNGIPKSDLASAVQTSLGLADSALQSVPNTYRTAQAQDVIDAGKVPTTRKVNNKPLSSDITLTPADLGIGSVFQLKGSKPTYADLPASGNTIGDVWYVVDDSVGYIWLNDGTTNRWEQLGMEIDLSAYRTSSAQDVIDGAQNDAINAKYTKPSGGIPKSDLASAVQTSLDNADAAAKQSDFEQFQQSVQAKFNELGLYRDADGDLCEE